VTLELNNIRVAYSGKTVIRGITVKARAGELIALVGPNGSGKSSLLKAVAGLILHEGQTNLPPDTRTRASSLAYLAQDATAPVRRKVRDIVALGRTPHIGPLGKLTLNDDVIISDSLSRCDMTEFSDREFGTLSGGEQMRVHLARTFATQAQILLADEPVTALDPYYQLTVMDALRGYAGKHRTVITALHDLNLARRYADRIWVIHDGILVKDSAPDEALDTETLAQVFRITPDGQSL